MNSLTALQKFLVSWMDQLWWSMRDRVGALSIIDCLEESWQTAGREVAELITSENLSLPKAVGKVLTLLGKTVDVEATDLYVTSCPLWDRIKARGLEYAYRCEEFACAPLLKGLKEGLGASEVTVETSMRIAHINRARLEYKLTKLKAAADTDSKVAAERSKIKAQLEKLPEHPVCIFHIK